MGKGFANHFGDGMQCFHKTKHKRVCGGMYIVEVMEKKSNIMLFYGLCSKSFVMLFWFLLLFQSVVILRADVRKRGRVPGVQKALAD